MHIAIFLQNFTTTKKCNKFTSIDSIFQFKMDSQMIAAPAESLPDNNAIASLLLLMVFTKKSDDVTYERKTLSLSASILAFFCCSTLGSSIGFPHYVILSSVLLAEVTVFVISSHLPPCPQHCYNIYLLSPCPRHCYNIYLSPPCPQHCYNIQLLLLSSLHWF